MNNKMIKIMNARKDHSFNQLQLRKKGKEKKATLKTKKHRIPFSGRNRKGK